MWELRKILLWMCIGGIFYYAIEGIWRMLTKSIPPHPAIMIVGGLCFVLVGAINQHPKFYQASMASQAVIGAFIVLAVEFISGCILNLWLGLGIWDYSNLPFNIMGQVCLFYGILWALLMPLAIWLEDRLNMMKFAWDRYRGNPLMAGEPLFDYTLLEAYREFMGIKKTN